jgi:hypothetical protein
MLKMKLAIAIGRKVKEDKIESLKQAKQELDPNNDKIKNIIQSIIKYEKDDVRRKQVKEIKFISHVNLMIICPKTLTEYKFKSNLTK